MKKMNVQPTELTIKYSDGTEQKLRFTAFKPSRKSEKLNANAIAKAVLDGHMVQIGCNITVLD